MKDKATRKYFRRAYAGGRSAFARVSDGALLAAFAAAVCYAWFLSQVGNHLLALFLALIAAGMLIVCAMLWRSIRFDSFVEKHTAALRKEAILEALLLLPRNEVMDILLGSDPLLRLTRSVKPCREGFFAELPGGKALFALLQKHPSEKVHPSELLGLHRLALANACARIELYSTAEYEPETSALAGKLAVPPQLHPPAALIDLAQSQNLLPEESVIQEAVESSIRRHSEAMESLKKGALVPANTRRYLYAAGIILVSSFITGYRVYYPLMASLCLCLALISWWMGKRKEPPQTPSA